MSFAPGDPHITKLYLIELHAELSIFHELLARRSIPSSYQAEGCEQVAELMTFIENLTNRQPV